MLPLIEQEVTNAAQKYMDDDCSINEFLIDQLRRMMSAIPLRYNNKYNRRGPLFEPRVKRVFIDADRRLKYLIAYVHNNAIHHGLEKTFGLWKYDSFSALNSDKKTLLVRYRLIKIFGSQENFKQYHLEFKKEDMDENID